MAAHGLNCNPIGQLDVVPLAQIVYLRKEVTEGLSRVAQSLMTGQHERLVRHLVDALSIGSIIKARKF